MRKFSSNLDKVLLFGSGAIVSSVVSALLGEAIGISLSALVFSVIVVSVLAVSYFKDSHSRIQELADTMEVSAKFIYELYRENENIRFSGVTYDEVSRLVSGAKKHILVLASLYKEGDDHKTDRHAKRLLYLEEIERRVAACGNLRFTYIRINQVDGDLGSVCRDSFDDMSNNHFDRVFEIERRYSPTNQDLEVDVLVGEMETFYTYVIVDDRFLFLELFALDPEGDSYSQGAFVIEDRGGKLILPFLNNFKRMMRNARSLKNYGF